MILISAESLHCKTQLEWKDRSMFPHNAEGLQNVPQRHFRSLIQETMRQKASAESGL